MKTAVIVGGSGGIGYEIIKILISRDIHVINIDKVESIIKDDKLDNVICELDEKNVYDVAKSICLHVKEIDYFISTIGYYEARKIEDITADYLNEMLKVNLYIPTVFAQEIYKLMKQGEGGKMVIILSAAAYIGSRDLAYSISKAGELGLVRSIAKSINDNKTFIYGIAPGIVRTKMSENMSQKRMNDAVLGTSMKKMCEPWEVANIVEYVLFKDEGYMSGSVIHINNGLYLN